MAAKAAEPIMVGSEPAHLTGHLEVLRDPSDRLTFADVAFGEQARDFSPVEGDYTSGFAGRGGAWLRFSIMARPELSSDEAERFLALNPPNLSKVRIYVATTAHPLSLADFDVFSTGASLPYGQRPVAHPGFLVPITLPAEPRLVLMYIDGQALLAVRGSIETAQSLFWSDTVDWLFAGGYLSACIFVAGINLAFWFWLRERYYLLYAAYALSLAGIAVWRSGLLFAILPQHAHQIYFPFQGLVFGLAMATGFTFLASFLQLRIRAPLAYRVAMLLAASGIVLAATIFVDQWRWLFAPLALLFAVLALVPIYEVVRLALKGMGRAQIYLFSFAPVNVALLALIARNMGWLPTSALLENGFQIGGVLHLVIMTIGLGGRIRQAENRRRAAEHEALAVAQSAERRAAQVADMRTRDLRLAKTELEEALAAERRLSREQLQFIDTVSHEYRTPVAVLRTNLDLLRMAQAKGAPPPVPVLKRIGGAISRLTEIIEISLKSDRIAGDPVTATTIAVDPRLLIEDAIQIARNVHPGRRVDFAQTGIAGDPVISADVALLKTALVNVLDNALKYSPGDTGVRVELESAGDEALTIAVSDDGMGINDKDLPYVFDKYYRAGNTAGRAGAGIGLHLVKSIVDAHGGKISLASSAAGTTCEIILPLFRKEHEATDT